MIFSIVLSVQISYLEVEGHRLVRKQVWLRQKVLAEKFESEMVGRDRAINRVSM